MSTSNRELIESALNAKVIEVHASETAVREADATCRGLREDLAARREETRNLQIALFALDGQDKSRADADAAIDEALAQLEEV